MGYGETTVVRQDMEKIIASAIARTKALYEQARQHGEQSLQSLTPVLTGALKESSKAETIEGIGFQLRSFGDESIGRGYAAFVNNGHHSPSGNWVPSNPFFSQSVADTNAVIQEGLSSIFG